MTCLATPPPPHTTPPHPVPTSHPLPVPARPQPAQPDKPFRPDLRRPDRSPSRTDSPCPSSTSALPRPTAHPRSTPRRPAPTLHCPPLADFPVQPFRAPRHVSPDNPYRFSRNPFRGKPHHARLLDLAAGSSLPGPLHAPALTCFRLPAPSLPSARPARLFPTTHAASRRPISDKPSQTTSDPIRTCLPRPTPRAKPCSCASHPAPTALSMPALGRGRPRPSRPRSDCPPTPVQRDPTCLPSPTTRPCATPRFPHLDRLTYPPLVSPLRLPASAQRQSALLSSDFPAQRPVSTPSAHPDYPFLPSSRSSRPGPCRPPMPSPEPPSTARPDSPALHITAHRPPSSTHLA